MNRTVTSREAAHAALVFLIVLIPLTLFAPAVRGAVPDDLSRWLDERVAAGEVAAASAAWITRQGVETVTVGDGIDATTQFQIGSVTKPFTHLLLAEMVASGDVGYDTRVGEILGDGFRPQNAAVRDVTLQELATHTSGLPRLPANLSPAGSDPYSKYSVDDLMAGLRSARAKQPLGEFYSYSNFGVGLLGHLLGRVDGRGFTRALQARVLEPLGLEATGMAPEDDFAEAFTGGRPIPFWSFQDSLAAAGALWSTPADLARLARTYLGGVDHGLRHSLAADLEVVTKAGDSSVTRVWHRTETDHGPIFWHNGRTAGHGAFVGFRPDTGRGIAIVVAGDADATRFGLGMLGREEPVAAESAAGSETAALDERIFGQYRLTPGFGLGVFAQDGVLMTQATGQPAFELHAVGDDWYALGAVDASLHFVAEHGRIVAVELAQGGRIQSAEKVADVARVAKRKEVPTSREALREYIGTYVLAPGAVFTLRLGDSGLEAQLSGQPFLPVFAKGEDVFFYKVVDAELHFERDEEGDVDALVLHQGGMQQRASRQDP